MVSIINQELIGSSHKTITIGNLFDFVKKRENMGLCVGEKFVSKPIIF